MEKLVQFDKSLFHFINSSLSNSLLDNLMPFMSGPYPWLMIAVGLFLWGLYEQGRWFLGFALAALLLVSLSDVIAFRVIKPSVERLRPCYELNHLRLLAESCGGQFGFPSNHAANAMALALFVFFCFRPF